MITVTATFVLVLASLAYSAFTDVRQSEDANRTLRTHA
jgi:hypothetical protein